MSEFKAKQSTEGFNCIFIRSDLDDAGLSPYEFRVYAHLARRASAGKAWPGKRSMAKICQMSASKIKECLSTLTLRGMIIREMREGITNLYTVINEPELWVGHQVAGGGPLSGQGGGHLVAPKDIQAEGNPVEGSSSGDSVSLKESGKVSEKTEASKNGSAGNVPPLVPVAPPVEIVTIPAKPKPIQPHVALVEAYGRAYQEVAGEPYRPTGRDWKPAVNMQKQGMSPEAIYRRALVAMRWPQQFLQEQAMAFQSFASNYSRYITVRTKDCIQAVPKNYDSWGKA